MGAHNAFKKSTSACSQFGWAHQICGWRTGLVIDQVPGIIVRHELEELVEVHVVVHGDLAQKSSRNPA